MFWGADMTVYLARTYVVKPEKLDDHNEWGKKLIALMKNKPYLFRGVTSLRVLRHKHGGSMGGFTALWGFESLANIEGWENGFTEIPEEKALRAKFMELIVPESYSACILEPIKTLKRKTKHKRPQK
jgi:antibiotic biosynthesis monooxygenase (ABM) superfamily enzyme